MLGALISSHVVLERQSRQGSAVIFADPRGHIMRDVHCLDLGQNRLAFGHNNILGLDCSFLCFCWLVLPRFHSFSYRAWGFGHSHGNHMLIRMGLKTLAHFSLYTPSCAGEIRRVLRIFALIFGFGLTFGLRV